MSRSAKPGLWLACAVLLAACATTNLSSVDDQGHVVGAPQFPNPDRASMKEGSYPNLDNVRTVQPGMNMNQLYGLLGPPHFHEGFTGIHEWDYIFNFRTGPGSQHVTCQFKILFDRASLAQQFFWKPSPCPEQVHAGWQQAAALPVPPAPLPAASVPTAPAPAESKEVAMPVAGVLELRATARFAFNRSDAQDIPLADRQQLDTLASTVRSMHALRALSVQGYTDRIGASAYNQHLSQQRAETVRNYLVALGVPASKVLAQGRGAQDPMVSCREPERSALIDCLQPNRRAEARANAQN